MAKMTKMTKMVEEKVVCEAPLGDNRSGVLGYRGSAYSGQYCSLLVSSCGSLGSFVVGSRVAKGEMLYLATSLKNKPPSSGIWNPGGHV